MHHPPIYTLTNTLHNTVPYGMRYRILCIMPPICTVCYMEYHLEYCIEYHTPCM